jgi:hypothetical protein
VGELSNVLRDEIVCLVQPLFSAGGKCRRDLSMAESRRGGGLYHIPDELCAYFADHNGHDPCAGPHGYAGSPGSKDGNRARRKSGRHSPFPTGGDSSGKESPHQRFFASFSRVLSLEQVTCIAEQSPEPPHEIDELAFGFVSEATNVHLVRAG